MTYAKPQQKKKEESERLRGAIKSNLLILDLRDGQVARFRKARGRLTS